MSDKYYLIVNDDEMEQAGDSFKSFANVLESAFEQYHLILDDIAINAAPFGEVHDAIVLFSDYVAKVQEISSELGEKFARLSTLFVSDIESADDYLYDAGIANITRDFSMKEYQFLLKCLDNPWSSITDNIGDWIYSKIIDVANLFHWDNVKAYLNSCCRLLLDYNDETAQGLKLLFDNVHAVDKTYGNSIAGGLGNGDVYTSYFDYIILTMCELRNMLDAMAEIIDPSKQSFTVDAIEARLGSTYSELLKYYDETMAIPEAEVQPTIEQISDFASQSWAYSYFGGFFTATNMFILDLGLGETIEMVIFNMFDIFEENYLENTDPEAYSENKMKDLLLTEMDDMLATSKYSDSDQEQILSDLQKVAKYVKKYGSKIFDDTDKDGMITIDGVVLDAGQFEDFFKSVSNAEKILEYGDKGIEYLSRLFIDYTQGLEILDSFERNFSGNEEVLKCVNEIKALYNKEFNTWMDGAIEVAKSCGIDVALSALEEANPVFKVVGTIKKSIKLVGTVTGLSSESAGMLDALTYQQLQTSFESAYKEALQKVKIADPNSDEYPTLAADLEHCFDLCKRNMINMFKAMAKASNGTKKSYYSYCAKQAEELSMSDTSCPNILTYDEFLAMKIE